METTISSVTRLLFLFSLTQKDYDIHSVFLNPKAIDVKFKYCKFETFNTAWLAEKPRLNCSSLTVKFETFAPFHLGDEVELVVSFGRNEFFNEVKDVEVPEIDVPRLQAPDLNLPKMKLKDLRIKAFGLALKGKIEVIQKKISSRSLQCNHQLFVYSLTQYLNMQNVLKCQRK